MRPALAGAVLVTIFAGALSARAEGVISDVSVSPPFFNPTVGQKEQIAFSLAESSDVTVSILDRDLIPIRVFPSQEKAQGAVRVEWDGRDGLGRIVPDEAYSVQIVCKCAAGDSTYSPATGYQSTLSEPKRSYSMASGVLRYELERPSRMHIQAGQAVLLADGKRAGPVLRTVVDREPRSSGAIAEPFDGFDVSGKVLLPSLRDFAISIMAESLPPTSMITVGNRAETFRHYAASRNGLSHVLSKSGVHSQGQHHQGLNSLEDHTPALTLKVHGRQDTEGRIQIPSKPTEIKVEMTTEDAEHFMRPDTTLMLFVDEKAVSQKTGMTPPALVSLDLSSSPPGEHRIAVNWVSPSGPVGVQVVRIVVEPEVAATAGVR